MQTTGASYQVEKWKDNFQGG